MGFKLGTFMTVTTTPKGWAIFVQVIKNSKGIDNNLAKVLRVCRLVPVGLPAVPCSARIQESTPPTWTFRTLSSPRVSPEMKRATIEWRISPNQMGSKKSEGTMFGIKHEECKDIQKHHWTATGSGRVLGLARSVGQQTLDKDHCSNYLINGPWALWPYFKPVALKMWSWDCILAF